jgi:hypothetical protein
MEFNNIHHEPNLITQYQKEYSTLIDHYTQLIRPSIFVKYYNINLISENDSNLFSTYDHYTSSNIIFDIYEYTPAYFIQAINNRSSYDELGAGDILKGLTSLSINTIKRPRVNDLITFYSPISNSNEIFQVTEISTTVNMLHSEVPLNFYELDLEYAPIENIRHLSIKDHYIFDLSIDKYLLLEDYRNKINDLNNLYNILNLIKLFYNRNLDIYIANNRYIPLACNDILFKIKEKYLKKLNDIIFNYPYGLLKIQNLYDINPYLNISNLTNLNFDIFDISTSEIISITIDDLNSPKNELENLILYGYRLIQHL